MRITKRRIRNIQLAMSESDDTKGV
jgi:hypothetical protein